MTFTPAQLLCAFAALLLTASALLWHAMDKISEGRSISFPLVPKASANVSPLTPVSP